jgi:hypothetical protein
MAVINEYVWIVGSAGYQYEIAFLHFHFLLADRQHTDPGKNVYRLIVREVSVPWKGTFARCHLENGATKATVVFRIRQADAAALEMLAM